MLLQEGGHETEALPWGDPNEGTKDAWERAGLGDKLSAQRHIRHPNVHAPFRIPITPNHQYLPKLLLSSPQDQVREDRVVRELRPCGELVTMPRKVESEVEFALCNGVGCREITTGHVLGDHQEQNAARSTGCTASVER